MPRRVSVQFYPNDWIGDPNLELCSLAAHGLWINMLVRMWQSSEFGVLKTGSRPWKASDIFRAVGCTEDEGQRLLSELRDNGVCERREDDGAFYSRRAVRDAALSAERAKAGRKGAAVTNVSAADKFAAANGAANRSANPVDVDVDDSSDSSGREKDPRSTAPKSTGAPGKTTARSKPAMPPIPPPLCSADFMQAWEEWTDHRRHLRKPMTPQSAKRLLAKCATLGTKRAVSAIEHSIERGWQGIFEPDTQPRGRAVPGGESEAERERRRARLLAEAEQRAQERAAREARREAVGA